MLRFANMEIALLENNTLKIKGKKATIIVDPKKGLPKQTADGILIFDKGNFDPTRIDENRVVIDEPGEYEVGGIKISGITNGKGIFYSLNVDDLDMVLAKTSTLSKFSDEITEPKVAIINVDSELDSASLAAIEPRVVVLYGEKAEAGIKALGKEGITRTKKFAQTPDKLPEEMQVIWLA